MIHSYWLVNTLHIFALLPHFYGKLRRLSARPRCSIGWSASESNGWGHWKPFWNHNGEPRKSVSQDAKSYEPEVLKAKVSGMESWDIIGNYKWWGSSDRFKYRKAVTGLDQGWLDLPTLVFAAVCWFVVVRQTQVQRAMLQSRHIMFGDWDADRPQKWCKGKMTRIWINLAGQTLGFL
jgi:hypothetical protein